MKMKEFFFFLEGGGVFKNWKVFRWLKKLTKCKKKKKKEKKIKVPMLGFEPWVHVHAQ